MSYLLLLLLSRLLMLSTLLLVLSLLLLIAMLLLLSLLLFLFLCLLSSSILLMCGKMCPVLWEVKLILFSTAMNVTPLH